MFSEKTFSVRNDLVISRIRQGAHINWVVKDPVTRKFFYFNEQEHAILTWLDGTSTVQTVIERFGRKFAPLHLSRVQLSQFLAQLSRADLLQGLVAGKRASQETTLAHRLGGAIGNPLAIRLPGVNPSRFLDLLAPWCLWMFSRPALISAGFVILLAFVCAVIRFDDFLASVPLWQAWGTSQVLLTTAYVVVVTKIIHELAHALTARYFGVRCESMGVLLLVFTPCLYCDVSDAWLLASRRARIAISAAGILVELLMASVATLLWAVSRDESSKAVLATVMVVCSVSTVFFNGNPLMKYDGYFILSDWLRMPNLAGDAAARLMSGVRGWIWGEETDNSRPYTVREQVILSIYGILAFLYRLVLMTLILFGIFKYLDDKGLGVIGVLLAMVTCTLFFMKGARTLLRPPSQRLTFQSHRFSRPAMALSCIFAVLLSLALLPIPRRLDAPFRIESRESRDVFVPVAGQLVSVVRPGQFVKAGDQLAELRNPKINLELHKIDLQLASQRSRLQSLESRRGLLEHADERPTLLESIAGLEKKRTVLAREQQELVIHAPLSGIVHEPPNVVDQFDDNKSVSFWTGTPLDPRNHECYLEQGTQLCTITGEDEKLAVLYLSQRRVQRIRVGQSVRLWFPGLKAAGVDAEVIEITPAPLEEIPRELLAKNVIAMNPKSAPGTNQPQEPMYRIIARISATGVSLPLRATGQASIRVSPVSPWKTIREFIYEAFDF